MQPRFITSPVDPRSLSIETRRIARPTDAQRFAIHGRIEPLTGVDATPLSQRVRRACLILAAFATLYIAGQMLRGLLP